MLYREFINITRKQRYTPLTYLSEPMSPSSFRNKITAIFPFFCQTNASICLSIQDPEAAHATSSILMERKVPWRKANPDAILLRAISIIRNSSSSNPIPE